MNGGPRLLRRRKTPHRLRDIPFSTSANLPISARGLAFDLVPYCLILPNRANYPIIVDEPVFITYPTAFFTKFLEVCTAQYVAVDIDLIR